MTNSERNPATVGSKSALALGLRVARGVTGLSDVELAKRAHVGLNTVRRAERGEMIPREPQLRRIAEALAGSDEAE